MVSEFMASAEEARGAKIIRPGQADWFPAQDWRNDSVIALLRGEALILWVKAVKENQGAFRKLIRSLDSAGLRPIIVEPIGKMEDICINYGGKIRWTELGDETRAEFVIPA